MRVETNRQIGQWFRVVKKWPSPRARLVCFPHAGGAASFFRSWQSLVPDGYEVVAVRYPGREDRLVESPAESMNDLAQGATRECLRLVDAPLVLFGHSMGASVAYEVTRRLKAEHGMTLPLLFVSGRAGPGRETIRGYAKLSEVELLEHIESLGGMDSRILNDPDLRDLVLPAIRADYRLIEEYARQPARTVLDTPIVAYYGTEEEDLDGDSVEAWSEVTRAGFAKRGFSGGHFYLADHLPELLGDVMSHLRSIVR